MTAKDSKNHLSDYHKDDIDIEPNLTGSSHINVGWAERVGSIAGGVVLAYLGTRKLNVKNVLLSIVGGAFLYRGITGHCDVNEFVGRDTSKRSGSPVIIKKSITINRPRQEVYSYYRKLENLPNFMKYLKEVKPIDEHNKRYHWEVEPPKGVKKVEWDAEIVEDKENELISYRTFNGSDVSQAGEVSFKDAPGDRGTELHTTIKYYPPLGSVGGGVAKLINPYIEAVVKEDLSRLRALLETGEIPTVKGQPSGRKNNK